MFATSPKLDFVDETASIADVARGISGRTLQKKSRTGCTTCKVRHVKCDEGRPTCGQCARSKRSCAYNTGEQTRPRALVRNEASFSVSKRTVQTIVPKKINDTNFEVRDLGFLHNFITKGVHPLPLGNREAWTRSIPQIAHTYPYLLHAILANGASDLVSRLNTQEQEQQAVHIAALAHRAKAIKGLQKAIAATDDWQSPGHADAALATSYLLMNQAANIDDGVSEFAAFAKGCALVTEKIAKEKLKTELQLSPMQFAGAHLDAHAWDEGKAHVAVALEQLEPIGETLEDEHNLKFWAAMQNTLQMFKSSPTTAHDFSLSVYSSWYHLAGELLVGLQNEDTNESLVLVVFFLANMAMLNLKLPCLVFGINAKPVLDSEIVRQACSWVHAIEAMLSTKEKQRIQWPKLMLVTAYEQVSSRGRISGDEFALHSKRLVLKARTLRAHKLLAEILHLGSCMTSWFAAILPGQKYSNTDIVAAATKHWLSPESATGTEPR